MAAQPMRSWSNPSLAAFMSRCLTAGIPAPEAQVTPDASPELPEGLPAGGRGAGVVQPRDAEAGGAADVQRRRRLRLSGRRRDRRRRARRRRPLDPEAALRREALAELQRGSGLGGAGRQHGWAACRPAALLRTLPGRRHLSRPRSADGRTARPYPPRPRVARRAAARPAAAPRRRTPARAGALPRAVHDLLAKGFAGRERELDSLRNYVGVQKAQTLVGQTVSYLSLWASTITGIPAAGRWSCGARAGSASRPSSPGSSPSTRSSTC